MSSSSSSIRGSAKAMFEDAREPIEAGSHLWDTTVITSYFGAYKMNTFME